MIFVGIDWSSRFDDVSILDEGGNVVKEFRIAISPSAFRKLLEILDSLEPDRQKVVIGIETERNILAEFLISSGYSLYNLNPLCVLRFKQRFRVNPKKDDRFDARMIALMLLKDREEFSPVQPSTAQCIEMNVHCSTVSVLVRERTALVNRMRADLALFFPSFSRSFSKLHARIPMEILELFPSPAYLNGMTLPQFVERTGQIKRLSQKRAEQIYEALVGDGTDASRSPSEDGLILRTTLFLQQLRLLNEQILKAEQAALSLFRAHELGRVFESLPGSGPRLGPRLLAQMGDNPTRFNAAAQFQSYAGTAPVTEQSGLHTHRVKMRRGCRKDLRCTLYQMANASRRREPWAQAYYLRQRTNGKSHPQAIRSLSNKWAKIIYAIWRDRTPYSTDVFLKLRTG